MVTREDLYKKFGITAEAAQLFETALGNLLLGAEGLQREWAEKPDPSTATSKLENIEKSTLGRLLRMAQSVIDFDNDLITIFGNALNTRNRLIHGFYERHGFQIQTESGRETMVKNLEEMHRELFNAWQLADAMSRVLVKYIVELKTNPDASGRGPVEKITFTVD